MAFEWDFDGLIIRIKVKKLGKTLDDAGFQLSLGQETCLIVSWSDEVMDLSHAQADGLKG